MASGYDWSKSCYGSHEAKEAFHACGKRMLKKLSKELGFETGSFEVRSNKGGPAVSGEVILHHNDIYIQLSNPGTGMNRGIMLRTVKNRKDYEGGQNHFAPLNWLDDENRGKLKKLATQVLEQKLGFDADKNPDRGYNPLYSTPRVSK